MSAYANIIMNESQVNCSVPLALLQSLAFVEQKGD